MNHLIEIGLATAAAFWLWQNKREQIASLARRVRDWAEGQWEDPVARKRYVLGGMGALGLAGVLYLGGKAADALDRIGRPGEELAEALPPPVEPQLPQPILIQPPDVLLGDRRGGYGSGFEVQGPSPGETLAGGLGGIKREESEPVVDPEPGVPKLAGWLDHAERPEPSPELPEAPDGLLWSVRGIPSTGEEPNVGRIAVDSDGLRVYSYSHDNNNPAMDSGVFVTQWLVADGAMVWSQRLNGDLPPAFNEGNSHLFVYDEQPIQSLVSRPVPGNSALHPIWVLSRIMGGITGPVPTFPLTAFRIQGDRRGQWLEGFCPRDRDVSGVSYSVMALLSTGSDYFPNEYDKGFRYVEQASGVRGKVRRHLLSASVDVGHIGHRILTASRHEPLVRVFDMGYGNLGGQSGVYRGHHRAVELIRTDGYMALTADRDGCHYWDSRRPPETIRRTPLPEVSWTSLNVSPEFDYAYLGTESGELYIYDLTHGAFVGMPIEAHEGPIRDIAVSPDWRRVFTMGADGMLKCWGTPALGPHGPGQEVHAVPVAADPPAPRAGRGDEEPPVADARPRPGGDLYLLPDFETGIDLVTYERVSLVAGLPPEHRESTARDYAEVRTLYMADGVRPPTAAELSAIDAQLARMRSYEGDPPREEFEELDRQYGALWPEHYREAMRR